MRPVSLVRGGMRPARPSVDGSICLIPARHLVGVSGCRISGLCLPFLASCSTYAVSHCQALRHTTTPTACSVLDSARDAPSEHVVLHFGNMLGLQLSIDTTMDLSQNISWHCRPGDFNQCINLGLGYVLSIKISVRSL